MNVTVQLWPPLGGKNNLYVSPLLAGVVPDNEVRPVLAVEATEEVVVLPGEGLIFGPVSPFSYSLPED